MAGGKFFEVAFRINAIMQGNFAAAMANARRNIELLGSATIPANRQFEQGQQKAAELARELRKLQGIEKNVQTFNTLQQRMQTEGAKSSRAFASMERQLAKVKTNLVSAGFSVDDFAKSEQNLRARIEETARAHKIAAEAQSARTRQAAARQSLQENNYMARSNFSNAQMELMSTARNMSMIAAPFVGMIETAANFEAAMSKVKAITNATGEETQKLTAKARELGETTRFSATQSAEAMSYLGMAGWKTEQILAGMKPMLSLAAAGGTDLARTADILSDDLTAFGLTANDAQHMADVFAYTISNSNTTVEMMGESMKYAAPVAKAYGATMEETAAMIGLMANAGIKASQAGTSLRAGFLRLAGPPKKASKELEALGINLSDAQREMEETQATLSAYGIKLDENMPPQQKMVSVIRQLSENTQGLSDEQRLAALSAIFGTNAASGWLNVINQGPEKLEKFINALKNCDGTADRMAGTMEDNAKGAATRLNSAIESLQISLGSAFLPTVADAAGGVANWAGQMSKWAAENQGTIKTTMEWGAALMGLYGAVKIATLAHAGYTVIAAAMNGSTLAYIMTSKSFTLTTKLAAAAQWLLNAAFTANPVGLFIAGVAAAIAIGYALYTNWQSIIDFFKLCWENPKAALRQFVDYVKQKWEELKFLLQNPITAAINFVSKGNVMGMDESASAASGMRAIRENATGGIYNRPLLTWVAEAGAAEAIVPLDGSRRAAALWQQAGQMLGLLPEAGRSAGEKEKPLPSLASIFSGITVPKEKASFSAPPININLTINGDAEPPAVRHAVLDAAGEAQESFADMWANLMHEKGRVSFA